MSFSRAFCLAIKRVPAHIGEGCQAEWPQASKVSYSKQKTLAISAVVTILHNNATTGASAVATTEPPERPRSKGGGNDSHTVPSGRSPAGALSSQSDRAPTRGLSFHEPEGAARCRPTSQRSIQSHLIPSTRLLLPAFQ